MGLFDNIFNNSRPQAPTYQPLKTKPDKSVDPDYYYTKGETAEQVGKRKRDLQQRILGDSFKQYEALPYEEKVRLDSEIRNRSGITGYAADYYRAVRELLGQ